MSQPDKNAALALGLAEPRFGAGEARLRAGRAAGTDGASSASALAALCENHVAGRASGEGRHDCSLAAELARSRRQARCAATRRRRLAGQRGCDWGCCRPCIGIKLPVTLPAVGAHALRGVRAAGRPGCTDGAGCQISNSMRKAATRRPARSPGATRRCPLPATPHAVAQVPAASSGGGCHALRCGHGCGCCLGHVSRELRSSRRAAGRHATGQRADRSPAGQTRASAREAVSLGEVEQVAKRGDGGALRSWRLSAETPRAFGSASGRKYRGRDQSERASLAHQRAGSRWIRPSLGEPALPLA